MYNFCTLFDKNYLLKGLALHQSLIKYAGNFRIWVLCMDEETFDLLSRMNLENVHLIKLEDFEKDNPDLLKIKDGRKKSEYCWTCAPFLPSYVLQKSPGLDMVAYLDADLFFYGSPDEIYEEFGNDSIMIIPHNYSNDQKYRESLSGTYNVGMLIFRNDQNARECLSWWQGKVLDWCFDYPDNGRLGDQAYLNDWPERFKDVCVLKNEGANVASWNMRKYKISEKSGRLVVMDKKSEETWNLIFYHFHGAHLHLLFNKTMVRDESSGPDFSPVVLSLYSQTLTEILDTVRRIDKSFSYGLESRSRYIKWLFKRTLQNIFQSVA
jgi:hypothetical protein